MRYFQVSVFAICLCVVLAFDNNYPNTNVVDVRCESGSQKFTRIGKKHYFIEQSQKVSWFEAAHLCRKIGGDLALIESLEEMNAVSNHLQKSFGNDDWFWISGNDLATTLNYVSITNGLRLPYTRWSAGQPDNPGVEHCMHLWLKDSAFRMNNWLCDSKAYYLCQTQNYTRCRDIY